MTQRLTPRYMHISGAALVALNQGTLDDPEPSSTSRRSSPYRIRTRSVHYWNPDTLALSGNPRQDLRITTSGRATPNDRGRRNALERWLDPIGRQGRCQFDLLVHRTDRQCRPRLGIDGVHRGLGRSGFWLDSFPRRRRCCVFRSCAGGGVICKHAWLGRLGRRDIRQHRRQRGARRRDNGQLGGGSYSRSLW
jgi:hypothetical protein